MKKGSILMLVIFYVCLTGCATIMDHGPKILPIISSPDGADLEIKDGRLGKSIVKAKTPYTATLERGDGFFLKKYYELSFSKDGYIAENVKLTPDISFWYFFNPIFGGGIGMILVDPLTGSMWKFYEDKIEVKMFQDTPEGKLARTQYIADEAARKEAAEKEKQKKMGESR